MNTELSERLKQLGIALPPPLNPLGSYRSVAKYGYLLHVSGLGPVENGRPVTGIVGDDVSIESAREAAELTMRLILASLDQACGLENVERCVRLTVYVRANAEFTQHPQVADGASDLLLRLWGDGNLPARSAIGVYTLPMGIPVEIDSVFVQKK